MVGSAKAMIQGPIIIGALQNSLGLFFFLNACLLANKGVTRAIGDTYQILSPKYYPIKVDLL